MVNSEALRLQLVQNIINLPDDKLTVVQVFLTDLISGNGAQTIQDKRRSKTIKEEKDSGSEVAEFHPDDDPIFKFIGLASYDPPAKSIDEELYGET